MKKTVNGAKVSFIQERILRCFVSESEFNPNLLSVEEILEKRSVTESQLADVCRDEADKLVAKSHLHFEYNTMWVFDRDNQQRYYWRKATFEDKVNFYKKTHHPQQK